MFLFRNVTIDNKKEIRSSLKVIYGLSWYKANLIAYRAGLSYPFFNNNLNDYLINNILFFLKGLVISESKINRFIENNLNKYLNNLSYRGLRHKLTLPVRGQRSRTNSATQRRKRYLDEEENIE
jgi:small subunit ribosomal protein S13